jgi:hypothetical protein
VWPHHPPRFPASRGARDPPLKEASNRFWDALFDLFRLPEEVEQDLQLLVQSGSEEVSPAILCQDKQTALDALTDRTGSAKKNGVGPVAIGKVIDLADELTQIASVYRSAFVSGARAFPYLVK